jgi:outer membrane protein
MKKNNLATTIVVAAACWTSAAQGEDLIQVYDMALLNNPTLNAAAARLRSTKEGKTQVRSNLLPNISGTATYSETSGDFALVSGDGADIDSTRENLGLTLNQTIYQHSNYTQLDAARSRIEGSDADYLATVQDLMLFAAERYLLVLTNEDSLTFAQAEEKANARQLDQAEQRYEVGLTAITDVHEARSSYDRARANAIVAQNDLDDAKEALRELTGQYIATVKSFPEELPSNPPQPADMEAWVVDALENNPRVLSSKFNADVAHHNVRTQRAGHYPFLGAQIFYSDTTNGGDVGAFSTETINTTSIGVQLTVPIYEGGAVNSRTRQAAYDYDAALEDLENQRRIVTRQTRNDYRAVIAGISQVQAFKQAVVSARSALEATEAGFEVGTRTIVDVLISQRSLFQAERDYSQARHQYVFDNLRLRASAGTITREHLNAVNALLVR